MKIAFDYLSGQPDQAGSYQILVERREIQEIQKIQFSYIKEKDRAVV